MSFTAAPLPPTRCQPRRGRKPLPVPAAQAEWFIHIPLFDFLLGFPIQLLGLLSLPLLYIRYFQENADPVADAEAALGKITRQLPGLDK